MASGRGPSAKTLRRPSNRAGTAAAWPAGRKVAAHAHGAQGIKNALIAGVDSIEHGSLIDDEGIRMMVERGTWLVADIYNDDYILGKAVEFGLPQENVDKERMVGRLQRENFQKAVEAGVKIAFGTDAGVYPHGDNAKQFHYMVKFGMTPAGAIRAATQSAADLIDRSKDVGTLEAGKYADLAVLSADYLTAPVKDIGKIRSVPTMVCGKAVSASEPFAGQMGPSRWLVIASVSEAIQSHWQDSGLLRRLRSSQ